MRAFKQNPHFSKIWPPDFVSPWICDKVVVTVNFGIRRKKIHKISSEVGTKFWGQNGGFLYTFKQCEKNAVTLPCGYTFEQTVF